MCLKEQWYFVIIKKIICKVPHIVFQSPLKSSKMYKRMSHSLWSPPESLKEFQSLSESPKDSQSSMESVKVYQQVPETESHNLTQPRVSHSLQSNLDFWSWTSLETLDTQIWKLLNLFLLFHDDVSTIWERSDRVKIDTRTIFPCWLLFT